ncbi:putative mitochondrial processing peptidase beta subunit mitochondrial precursor [Papiliotrema laurentii]|uniref:mitochondrial processing peptidase n=1 Tax=Papiliotrema laurentii TaxID=5418 RepID=A0AAD9FW07_PAPLA|nr:putative mitochondrial processing peptidase beta subunit mitochondrial precursor [Papiliotrema laurentii]
MSASRLISRSLGRQAPRIQNLRKPTFPLRTLATPVQTTRYADPVTHTSTLSNGLSISSETIPGMSTSSVALYIDAGSRADKMTASGAAHFLEHLSFKGTSTRNQNQLELEVENLGATLNAYTSREQTAFQAHSFDKDVPKMVEILADITQNSKLDAAAVNREKDVILREAEDVATNHTETLFDHLHSVAFQRQPLGNTILGPESHIRNMTRDHLQDFINTNYTADRMCLVGAGGISHEELVKLAEKNFGSLPSSPNPIPLGGASRPAPVFTGAEVRVRDDTMNTLHVAIAVEAVGWRSPDYWPMLVMSAVFGNWDRGLGASPLLSSKLSHIISSNNLANSYQHFFTNYSDTGLWGVNLITENLMNVDDLVHFTLREWTRMSVAPTVAEVERAKSQTKAAQLLVLDGTNAIADDIGRQMVTIGKRYTPKEVERYVDAVTPEDIKRVALKYLWDKDIALAAIGRTEGLLDYSRIRADMSSMIY